jgi:hypothetical protein
MATEFEVMEGAGILRDRWNGPAKRERHSAQRKAWKHAKETKRADQLSQYDKLMEELTSGNFQRKESLDRTKRLEDEIKEIRKTSGMSLSSDLRSKVQELQEKCSQEKQIRRDWNSCRQKIESTLQSLKGGGLSGTRVNGRRPTKRPSDMNPQAVEVTNSGLDDLDESQAQHNLDSDSDVLGPRAASSESIAGSANQYASASEEFRVASETTGKDGEVL